jgi:hypothetical protein
MIEQQKLLSGGVWPRFTHLLNDPEGTGITRNVKAQNPPATMIDDEEAVQHTEGKRRDGKEVHRCDSLAMVSQECQPAFAQVGAPGHSLQPS